MEDGEVDESVGGQEEVGDYGSDDVQLRYNRKIQYSRPIVCSVTSSGVEALVLRL